MTTRDVIVVGGGMVGATLANLLGRVGFSVDLVDARGTPEWQPVEPAGLRVSAVSPGSEAILGAAGAWANIAAERHCAYRRMRVEDGQGSGALEFEAAVYGFDHLGTIVENDLVTHALWSALPSAGDIRVHAPARLDSIDQGIDRSNDSVRCTLSNGTSLDARLLVGCDGAGSAVRRAVGIEAEAWEYNQKGVVARVRKSRPNPAVAWQRFHAGGPLAFLPLADGWSSIVWTLPSREAEARCDESETNFIDRLASASEGWLGDVEAVGPRAAFPLAMSLGDRYVTGRVVLLGDAAHAIHPLAGQGVNLGFADAASLVESLVTERAGGESLGATKTLRRFERWRRSESSLMAHGVHNLGALFRPATLSPLRALGMRLVGRSWTLREAFLRRAAGQGPHAPQLARGVRLQELGR